MVLGGHPVIIIHDEIIMEVGEANAEEAKRQLSVVMAEAFLSVFPAAITMSGLTESAVGDTWVDTKPRRSIPNGLVVMVLKFPL
mgnify:CR=1 FL=1|jgi:DNA polymerase I-like protein with 3'-5' exonuclease and polymerase domains|tara:strand:- start:213 stop:464 length:252 start_codon:yes stop_codon:yes gene_type:complete